MRPFAAAILFVVLISPVYSPSPAAAQSQKPMIVADGATPKFHVGQRVEVVDNGKWYKAVITSLPGPDKGYGIHYIGYPKGSGDTVEGREWLIHPDGSEQTEPLGRLGEANDEVLRAMRGAAPVAVVGSGTGGILVKRYSCQGHNLGYTGTVWTVQAVPEQPFAIDAGGRYTDSNGVHGTYTYDSASSTLTFHGGKNDNIRAQHDANGTLHILSPRGLRVIDCG